MVYYTKIYDVKLNDVYIHEFSSKTSLAHPA